MIDQMWPKRAINRSAFGKLLRISKGFVDLDPVIAQEIVLSYAFMLRRYFLFSSGVTESKSKLQIPHFL